MGATHVTPAGGNVFADLGFPENEAESLKIRSTLMIPIHRTIDERGLTKKDAARLFAVAQPRITALRRGAVGSFTIDELVGMLTHAHLQGDVSVISSRLIGCAFQVNGWAHTESTESAESFSVNSVDSV